MKADINLYYFTMYIFSAFQARLVTKEELLLVHSRKYIEMMKETADMKVHELTKMQDVFRSIYLHPKSYKSACLAAGSILQVSCLLNLIIFYCFIIIIFTASLIILQLHNLSPVPKIFIRSRITSFKIKNCGTVIHQQ